MAKKEKSIEIIPQEIVENRILLIRGKKVMLDKDLAGLYGIETFNLNKAVKRNIERFPDDFMFQLSQEEFNDLKFHFGISTWGGTRKLPFVFTENGVAMLSSALRSSRAVQVNIQIMRTFTRIRELITTHNELQQKLDEMENKYDQQFKVVFDAIRQLMVPKEEKEYKIGFERK